MGKPEAQRCLPRYERASQGLMAVFPSQVKVPVEASRRRFYPGLRSSAPDTGSLYQQLSVHFPDSTQVLDLGCGSGDSVFELSSYFDEVVGLDADHTAVRFANEYVPELNIQFLSPEEEWLESAVDLVTIVDVLGHIEAPAELVRLARRAVRQEGRVFLAEPRAYPSQVLDSPAQRAFSEPGLRELLVRSGLEVEAWLEEGGPYTVCIARPTQDTFYLQLAQADRAHREGDLATALEVYRQVATHAQGDLRTEGALGAAVVLAAKGEWDGACQYLLQAAETSPNDARPLAGLAEVCLVSNEPVEALTLAVRSLEKDACYIAGARALARAADRLGQADALATWRLANSLAPGDLASATELARMSAERGDLSYAIRVLDRVREFRGGLSCDYYVTLAWLLVSAGRIEDARVEAEVARAHAPGSAAVVELLAHLEAVQAAS